MTTSDVAVLAFGGRRVPGALTSLRAVEVDGSAAGKSALDEAIRGLRRVIVLGGDADLAAVLTPR